MECVFGQVNRVKIENLTKNFDTFVKEQNTNFKELRETNTKLYNHLSSRLPWWAMALVTAMGGIIGFLARIVFT